MTCICGVRDQHLGCRRPQMGVAMFCNAAHRSLELLLHVSVVWGINIWVVRGLGWVLQCFVTPHTDLSCQPVITCICDVRDQHLGHRRPRMGVAMFHNAAHRSLELLLHISMVWGINIWVVRGLRWVLQCFVTPHTDLLRVCYYMYLWCEGSGHQRLWMGVAMFRNTAHWSLESLLWHVSVVWGINIWVVRGLRWVLQCFVTPHTDLSCQPVITCICCARDQHLGRQRPQMENYNKYRSIYSHLHNLLKEIIQVRSKTQFHSGNKIDMQNYIM